MAPVSAWQATVSQVWHPYRSQVGGQLPLSATTDPSRHPPQPPPTLLVVVFLPVVFFSLLLLPRGRNLLSYGVLHGSGQSAAGVQPVQNKACRFHRFLARICTGAISTRGSGDRILRPYSLRRSPERS